VGIGGNAVRARRVGESIWGRTFIVPENGINLISLHQASKMAEVTLLDNGSAFQATFPNGEKFVFNCMEGIYECEMTLPRRQNRGNAGRRYNAEQKRRAEMVRELHCTLNHPSDDVLWTLLNSGSLMKCEITAKDVRMAANILGPCQHCIAGKIPEQPSPTSSSSPSSRVAELLHVDLVSVVSNRGRIPFIILKDDFSDYTMGRRLESKKKEEVFEGIKAMLNQFTAWGHDKGTIRTDAENVLKSIMPEVNGLGWRMEFTHPGRHERKVERFIRDMRNGIRTVVHSLSYQLPRKLYPDLVANIIATTNMLPSAKSSPITPQEIVVGIKPDKSLDLRSKFGTIAIFKDPDPTDDTKPRGEMGIVLGRDFYSRGAVKAFIISKGRVMTRGQFQTIGVTEEIKQINQCYW
jgi:hypothetical protein